MTKNAIGIQLLENANLSNARREVIYKWSILFLTYISMASYHMVMKPLSVVKSSQEFLDCRTSVCSSWVSELDGQTEDNQVSTIGS